MTVSSDDDDDNDEEEEDNERAMIDNQIFVLMTMVNASDPSDNDIVVTNYDV